MAWVRACALLGAAHAAGAVARRVQTTDDCAGQPPGCVSGTVTGDFLRAGVEQIAVDGAPDVEGYTTVRVYVNPVDGSGADGTPANIYAIFGDTRVSMSVPPAWQMPAPFGTNVGGTDPAFWSIPGAAASQFDSWLTIGVVDGNNHNAISAIGVDWETWGPDADQTLTITDGAVFWMDPDSGPSFAHSTLDDQTEEHGVILMQLTVPSGVPCAGAIAAQGRSHNADDWEELSLPFTVFGGAATTPPTPTPTLPPTPPPPPPPSTTCVWLGPLSRPSLQDVCRRAYPTADPAYRFRLVDNAPALPCVGSLDGRGCGLDDIQCCAPPPTAPPPPPTAVSCGTEAIMAACCSEPGADCSSGAPAVCGGRCRTAVLAFSQTCPEGAAQIADFVDQCAASDGSTTGGAGGLVGHLSHHGATAQYQCTFTELTGLALVCSGETFEPTTFCRTQCAAQLIPFSRQCAASMESSLQLLGLTDLASAATAGCDLASTATACPIDDIQASCATLSGAGGDAATLCSTDCVQMVVASFDACARSTDARVQALFSSETWQPVVDLCAAAGGLADQCSAVAQGSQALVAAACCSDATCSAPDDACSSQCSDVLMPYFRSCGPTLLATDPALMARYTALASKCAPSAGH